MQHYKKQILNRARYLSEIKQSGEIIMLFFLYCLQGVLYLIYYKTVVFILLLRSLCF